MSAPAGKPERQDRDRLARARLFEPVPGVWCIPLDLPGLTVGHVLSYALVTPEGIVIIDPGWDDQNTLSQLEIGLATGPDATVDDIVGIVATHGHGDHVGLAASLRERTGAWVAFHRREAELMDTRFSSVTGAVRDADQWLAALDVPVGARHEMLEAARSVAGQSRSLTPDLMLEDGQLLDIPGRRVVVTHTPGHSPGHVSLLLEQEGVVISGDHIIVDIFPSPMIVTIDPVDPLGDYLKSLDRSAREWKDLLVLPGHGTTFRDTPAQVTRILDRIRFMLTQTEELVADGRRTVWDIAQRLPWTGGWLSRSNKSKRAALGTTLAYLRHLEAAGTITADPSRLHFHSS